MCCQQFTVHKRKGKSVHSLDCIWLVISSSILVAVINGVNAQVTQKTREGANIPPTVLPIKRNKPMTLPCGADAILNADDEYFIETPNFNSRRKYPNSLFCDWKFRANNCNMGITCPNFALADFLCFDHMDVVNHNGSMNRYCGKNGPIETVLSNNVTISFTSSAWFTDIGFRCRLECREVETDQEGPFVKAKANETDCLCGVTGNKVTGGEPVEVSNFPWQAGLIRKGGSRPFCGGSLINSKYILTAAHCVQGRTPYNLEVLFNVTNVESGVGGGDRMLEVRRGVETIIVHKNFTSRLDYDAALIRLTDPVDISRPNPGTRPGSGIVPVCLPTEQDANEKYVGQNATITGWGLLSEDGELSPVLQQATVKIISEEECDKYYPTLTDRMLCAYTPGKDACQGDSGGPLVVQRSDQNPLGRAGYVQVGVVSWGEGCAVKPGVYTRVTELIKWINTNARDGSYCTNT